MTIYYLLSVLCRLAGIIQWADLFLHAHELKVKAKEVANAPTTRPELEKTLEKGEL